MSSYALSVDFRWILPKEVYDSRWRKQSWIVVHPTDALAFVRPQDRPHQWAWIAITYFIGLDYLKELCLVCSHAVQWRLFNKASRDRAKNERMDSKNERQMAEISAWHEKQKAAAWLSAKQKNQKVKKRNGEAKANGKPLAPSQLEAPTFIEVPKWAPSQLEEPDCQKGKSEKQEAEAAFPDIQELSKLPQRRCEMSAGDKQRIPCSFFVAGTCRRGKKCSFGHFDMAREKWAFDHRIAMAQEGDMIPSVAAALYGKS